MRLIPGRQVAAMGNLAVMTDPEAPRLGLDRGQELNDSRPLMTAQTAAVVRASLRETMAAMDKPRRVGAQMDASASGHQPVWRWPDLTITRALAVVA